MTEIEKYKEILKVVHNEYVDEIQELEETLEDAYKRGYVYTNHMDKDDCIAVMKATLRTASMSLKMHMDKRMEELNEI